MNNNHTMYNLKNNNWSSDNYNYIIKKVLIDEWWLEREYPFEINQRYKEVLSDETESAMKSTPGISRMSKMMMNSTYGLHAMHGSYGSTSIQMNMIHSAKSLFGIKDVYHANTTSVKHRSEIFVYLESAECAQKEMLIEHYTNKLSKISKKKEEFKILTDIVAKYREEVDAYIDKYPERFI